ncbi:MAG: hypothetical protein V3V52_02180 [Candidatus Adiutricales bacterium]
MIYYFTSNIQLDKKFKGNPEIYEFFLLKAITNLIKDHREQLVGIEGDAVLADLARKASRPDPQTFTFRP